MTSRRSSSSTICLTCSSLRARGWQVNPTTQMVEFANKRAADRAAAAEPGALEDKIPRRTTIASSLQFAKELESIV